MTFDPIKTVEALNVEIAKMQHYGTLPYNTYGLTPCEAFHLYSLEKVRDAIMAGITVQDVTIFGEE